MDKITACAVQLSPGEDMEGNLRSALGQIRSAAGEGARLIALPEYFLYYGREERWAEAASMAPVALEALRAEAVAQGVSVLAGSLLVPVSGSGLLANTSMLISPKGEITVSYVKRHLFDVKLDIGEYRESQWLVPGERIGMGEVFEWKLGLSICFDLRFPDHFQQLRRAGAGAIAVPSAFSVETGSAHWMTLIRARAIETQCYIIAPALWGDCGEGKKCFGSTAIIGPWGEVAAFREGGEGSVMADLDPAELERVRRKIPMFHGASPRPPRQL